MMRKFDIEYNSERVNMIIPEYGRNVQKLVDHAKTIEDKTKRQSFVEAVIDLMNIMVPSNRSLADNKQKMWNHIFKIANYDLDVEVPEGIAIHSIKEEKPVHDLQYPKATYKFRHYGAYVQKMVAKARVMENEEKQEGYKEAIASYMKLAYQTWNREHYVNDNIIIKDLNDISEGELKFDEDFSIDNLVSIKQIKHAGKKRSSSSHKKKYSKNNKHKSNKNKHRNK
jgi:hypothetical protein